MLCQDFGNFWPSENRLFERESSDGRKESILRGEGHLLIINHLACKICLRRQKNRAKRRVLRADFTSEIGNFNVLSWQT